MDDVWFKEGEPFFKDIFNGFMVNENTKIVEYITWKYDYRSHKDGVLQ